MVSRWVGGPRCTYPYTKTTSWQHSTSWHRLTYFTNLTSCTLQREVRTTHVSNMKKWPLSADLLQLTVIPRLPSNKILHFSYEKHIWLKPSHLRNSFVWNKTQDTYAEVRLDECIWLQFWWPSWRFLMLVAATFCCGKLTANGHWEAVARYFPYTKMAEKDSVLVIPWCLLTWWDQRTQEEFSDTYPIPFIYGEYKHFAQIIPQPIPAKRSTPPTSSSSACDLGWKTIPLGTPATLRILTLQKNCYFGLFWRPKHPCYIGSKPFQLRVQGFLGLRFFMELLVENSPSWMSQEVNKRLGSVGYNPTHL